MIVQLKSINKRYTDLSTGQLYVVIGIEADDYRILNDHGRPFLYPNKIFKIIDKSEPEDWITETGEDGERYAYPSTLNRSGFFEDFFNGNKKAITQFWRVVNERLAVAS